MRYVPRKVVITVAAILPLGLAGCADFGFPTTAESVCGASGFGCHQECAATPIPAEGTDGNTVSYHIGPATCPSRYISDARRLADQACRDRGAVLATNEPQISQHPASGPLPAAESVSFTCHR